MKSPIPDLRARLVADGALVALLGGQKVYQHEAAQGETRPLVMFGEISGQPVGETLQSSTAAWERRLSADCQAATPIAADAIGDRVVALLDNLIGTVGTIFVQRCRVVSDVTGYDDTVRICRRIVDFRITYHLA
ncbi:DUF3168 domain-containing protein [Bosea minatitlanensis]|uniref:DUF3168 domain-containing protein n=1 Tax=Bosea minatitlanensis TaxID=128782 RepID=A0ABW0F153_9HYPH|nr:DUF3168 domain-containing protein [Bosea minatitlanensis]MCT4492714.1 DUF3168 domain-containing protein [Bosea minatitlanensis]